jgi:hypothetical protein
MENFRPPLLTCEPVLTEAVFLLKREGREADPLFALLERGVIRIALDVQEEQADLRALMHRYRNKPCHLQMPAWFDCRNSNRPERSSPWTPIFEFTAAMGTR